MPENPLDVNLIPSLVAYLDYYTNIEVTPDQLVCIEQQI